MRSIMQVLAFFPDNDNCLVSSWSKWNKCTGTCGIGSKVRTRTIIRQPASRNKTCPKLTRKRRCRLPPCQKDKGRGLWIRAFLCLTSFNRQIRIYNTPFLLCSKRIEYSSTDVPYRDRDMIPITLESRCISS